MISIRHLSLRPWVQDVSFDVAAGEVFGLLGANGAGKTTTVECLLGLRRFGEGRLTVAGEATGSVAARAATGAVLQATALQDKVTPREALALYAAFHARPLGVETLLTRFGLTQKRDAAYETLSGGQKQRLQLALAFIGDPKVLVLDEPTAGLDVAARRALHEDIAAAKAEGRAVLITTHDMDEARALCDRVAVMAGGRIVATGLPGALALEHLILGGA
jgi:ABC-2 type transport system ATP-binding protein